MSKPKELAHPGVAHRSGDGIATAAIFGEMGEQLVHHAIFGGTDELPARVTQAAPNRTRAKKAEPAAVRHHTPPAAPRSAGEQQPERREPGFLGESAERHENVA